MTYLLKRRKLFATILLSCIIFTGCKNNTTSTSKTTSKYTSDSTSSLTKETPSQSKELTKDDLKIGKLFIGESLADVQKDFGKPTVKTIVHGIGAPQWEYPNLRFSVGGDPLFTIDVSSKDLGSTPNGIHIGSTEQEVQKAYPDAKEVQNNTQLFVQSKDSRGFTTLDIDFFISEGNVSRIIMDNDNP